MKALWPMLGVLVRHREQQDEIVRRIPQVLKDSRILSPFLVAKVGAGAGAFACTCAHGVCLESPGWGLPWAV